MYYYAIGKGGFGKVWKVEKKKSKELYAMKEMSKARIISKRSVKSVMNERMILADLKYPYVTQSSQKYAVLCFSQQREIFGVSDVSF